MKKKIIALLFIFIIIVTSFKISNATTIGKVYIESNTNMVQKGEEIEITINIENVKTAAYNYSLHFDELKFEYISNIENTNVTELYLSGMILKEEKKQNWENLQSSNLKQKKME